MQDQVMPHYCHKLYNIKKVSFKIQNLKNNNKARHIQIWNIHAYILLFIDISFTRYTLDIFGCCKFQSKSNVW